MNFIIYGDVNVGKTTVVEKTVKRLRGNNIECAGFYTKFDPSGRLLLISAESGSRKVLAARKNEFSSPVRAGKYWFNPDAIEFGVDLMDVEEKFLVVDELGKLEGRKRGFFPVFERIRERNYLGFLLSVRKGFVNFFRG